MSDKRKYLCLGLLFSLPVIKDSHLCMYDIQCSLKLAVIWTRGPDEEQCFFLFELRCNIILTANSKSTNIIVTGAKIFIHNLSTLHVIKCYHI